MGQTVSLDTKLLRLSSEDYFSVRDACQGTLILGAVGSGKTSSAKYLAGSFLKSGMGGIVLCAKPEESILWREYCKKYGRSSSLIVFDGNTPGINFIAYELARQGAQGLGSVIDTIMRILEIANAASPMPGKASDSFWLDTSRQMLRGSVPVLYAATGTVRIEDLLRFVRSAPTSPDQMGDPAWQRQSFFYAMFLKASRRLDDASGDRATSYWRNDFANLDTKTRGNILISLTTTLDRFASGWLRTAFCSDTTIVPELCFQGGIILMDMPALTRNEDGIIAQQLFKYLWQRAVLARNGLDPRQRERPVFLWADEAQYFLNSYDAEFLSTCRGSRACTVFLSQSLPTFYAKMGGENARDRVHHLLGNFATRIWHNNACAETNEWASRTIGRSVHLRGTFNESEGTNTSTGLNMGDSTNWGTNTGSGSSFNYSSGQGGNSGSWSSGRSSNRGSSQGGGDNRGRNRGSGSSEGSSWGYSEQMDNLVEAATFSRSLRTGGPANGNRVDAFWYQAGRTFAASGMNFLRAEFQQ